jgi:hypothetical protein
LLKAAEAQQLWSQALTDQTFARQTLELTCGLIPHFEAAALDLLWQIQTEDFVLVRALNTDEGLWDLEFAMMVRLGFFNIVNRTYRMAVPATLTLEKIRWTAIDLVKTVDDDDVDGPGIVRPELLLTQLSVSEAEVQRSRVIASRKFGNERNGLGPLH